MRKIILVFLILAGNSISYARQPNPFPIYDQAEKGDPEAMYQVAIWQSNFALQKTWLEKSATKGYKPAYWHLQWLERCKNFYDAYGLDHQYYQKLNFKHKQYILRVSLRSSEIFSENIIYDPLKCFKENGRINIPTDSE